MDEAQQSDIKKHMQVLGVSLSAHQLLVLQKHMEAVISANLALNLTRITKPSDFVRLHILDSMFVLPEVNAAPAGRLADIGAGAGFPGIPLAVASERQTTLIESVGKKADFLSTAAEVLDLSATLTVYSGRSEQLALENPHSFAVVIARAVAPLPSLIELATPLLELGGVFIAMKGKVDHQELRSGNEAAAQCGLSPVSDRSYRLPDGGEERRAIAYSKTGKSSINLPRRPGMARKRPIA